MGTGGVFSRSNSILPTEVFDPAHNEGSRPGTGAFDLISTPAYGVTKHNQSANLH